MFGCALHEDPGNVVHRGPVDQRFDKLRSRAKQSQQHHDQELSPVRLSETDQGAPRAVFGWDIHRVPSVALLFPKLQLALLPPELLFELS